MFAYRCITSGQLVWFTFIINAPLMSKLIVGFMWAKNMPLKEFGSEFIKTKFSAPIWGPFIVTRHSSHVCLQMFCFGWFVWITFIINVPLMSHLSSVIFQHLSFLAFPFNLFLVDMFKHRHESICQDAEKRIDASNVFVHLLVWPKKKKKMQTPQWKNNRRLI